MFGPYVTVGTPRPGHHPQQYGHKSGVPLSLLRDTSAGVRKQFEWGDKIGVASAETISAGGSNAHYLPVTERDKRRVSRERCHLRLGTRTQHTATCVAFFTWVTEYDDTASCARTRRLKTQKNACFARYLRADNIHTWGRTCPLAGLFEGSQGQALKNKQVWQMMA